MPSMPRPRALRLDQRRRISPPELAALRRGAIARVAVTARHPDLLRVVQAARRAPGGPRERVLIYAGERRVTEYILSVLAMGMDAKYLPAEDARAGGLARWLESR
jgi:hypothetical protein